jgi:hypothetical protein
MMSGARGLMAQFGTYAIARADTENCCCCFYICHGLTP